MEFVIDSPATILDMAARGGAVTQLGWAVVKEMWSGGDSWALRIDGDLVGIFGLYPIDGGAEAWFNVSPAAAEHMRFIIRHIRLTLENASYPEIVVLCTSKAGSRIARLVGFQFVETREDGEIWHAGYAQRKQWQGSCQATGRTAAAPHFGAAGATAG